MTRTPGRDPVLRREVVALRRLKKRGASEGKSFIATIIQIGKRLARVKPRVGHGNWLTWLRKNFDWSDDTARRYIGLYELSRTAKFRSLRNLPLEVLYALSRKDVSEEERNAIAESVETGARLSLAEVEQRMRADPKRATINTTPSPADNEARRTFVVARAPSPEDASEQRKTLTAEDLERGRRRYLIDLFVDFAGHLPNDRSFEEACAIVVLAGAERKRDSFSAAVALLHEFVGQLQRALNERLIDTTPTSTPTLHVIRGKDE
jgi:Protein of unknown function (DUF3102)